MRIRQPLRDMHSFPAPSVAVCSPDLPERAVAEALRVGTVAVDIETTGLNPKTDSIGTCQLFVPSGSAYVLRPGPDATNLKRIFEDRRIRKIFHHASFDAGFLRNHMGVELDNVVCTKIASKILFPEVEDHSLKALVERHLGIQLEKNPAIRISNWTAPDLSEEQLRYAVGDVLHLPVLMQALESQLHQAGRWKLAASAFDFIPKYVDLKLLGSKNVFEY
jgi:ribonuclease D